MTDSAPVASPATSRDFVTALLICGGIVAALAIGYRAPDPAAEQQAAEVAAQIAAAASPAAPAGGEPINAEFSLDLAMRLAGTQVPAELDSFYFFAMVDDVPEAVEAVELGAKLLQAAQEHDYLGVAGPDPERNRRTLLAALAARKADDLRNLVLIYVGPESHQAEVGAAARAARFEVRFVSYPETAEAAPAADAATAAPKAPI